MKKTFLLLMMLVSFNSLFGMGILSNTDQTIYDMLTYFMGEPSPQINYILSPIIKNKIDQRENKKVLWNVGAHLNQFASIDDPQSPLAELKMIISDAITESYLNKNEALMDFKYKLKHEQKRSKEFKYRYYGSLVTCSCSFLVYITLTIVYLSIGNNCSS